MTRRIIAFEVNGKFMVSQELNGDKSEQRMFGLPQGNLNWSDVIKTFDGSKTTDDFVAAVHSVENAYHYQQIPLAVVDELPVVEQLWLLKDGSLQLAYEYGKPVSKITRVCLELTWLVAYDIVGDTVEEKVKNLSEMSSDALADQIYDDSLQTDMEDSYDEDFLNEVAKIRDLEAIPKDPNTHITVEQYLDIVNDKNVNEKGDNINVGLGTAYGKYQDMETKLLALFTESDYVVEFGWASNDTLYVWVCYIFLKDFVDELTEILGNGVFDEGGINANMQNDCLCIDVDELLGSYINVEEIFPKDKFQH